MGLQKSSRQKQVNSQAGTSQKTHVAAPALRHTTSHSKAVETFCSFTVVVSYEHSSSHTVHARCVQSHVGMAVGVADGYMEGYIEGNTEGKAEGVEDGLELGSLLGSLLGVDDGIADG